MMNQLERVALADALWEEMIREEAQAIADRENACAGCCGPRGTDTWLDHEQSVRQRFEEIGKAFSARAAIAAMQGEPVAWMYVHSDGCNRVVVPLSERAPDMVGRGWTETPLYALPPAPTREELRTITWAVAPCVVRERRWRDGYRESTAP